MLTFFSLAVSTSARALRSEKKRAGRRLFFSLSMPTDDGDEREIKSQKEYEAVDSEVILQRNKWLQ